MPQLKPQVDDLSTVDESARGFYKEFDAVDDQGKATGKTVFRPDFGDDDPVAVYGGELKRAHARTKKEHDLTKAELAKERAKTDSWDKIQTELGADPGAVRRLYDRQSEFESATATHQAAVQEMKTQHESALRGADAKTSAEHARFLENVNQNRALAALGAGNRHTGLPGILARMKTQDNPAGGDPITVIEKLDGDDEIFMSQEDRDAGKTLDEFKTASDLVAAMKKSQAFGGCWESNAKAGSGADVDDVDLQSADGAVVLSREQALIPAVYRRAQKQAEKDGKDFRVAPVGT